MPHFLLLLIECLYASTDTRHGVTIHLKKLHIFIDIVDMFLQMQLYELL
jgi:hypothetical protein